MHSLFDRTDRTGCIANVASALAIVLFTNGLIFGLGFGTTSPHAPKFLPPPVVIGLVWVGLFVCMAIARWHLNPIAGSRSERAGIVALVALCTLYPVYTGGLKSDVIGEVANVALLTFAVTLTVRTARGSQPAAAWLLPVVAWLGFASVAGALTLAGS